ncbi:MAG: polysaccharide deacetylase [Rickettsiales bacterium]|nr:polysaccharide deacetylase [Rickettsiales bacterium]
MKADLQLYDYWSYENRPRIRWPNGAKVALWVAPNFEFYEFDPPRNSQRTPWKRPNPDIAGYGIRDYGNRVGAQRQMELLDKFGIRASVSLSAALCDHHPEIIEMCRERDYEFFSHGVYNTRYNYSLSQAEERQMLKDSLEAIRHQGGQVCSGYLAPALSHSEHTLDLFAEVSTEMFGPEVPLYSCDLFHDDQPTPLKTRSGRKMVSIPYSLELNDTIAYVVNKVEPRRYGQIIRDAFDVLYAEGAESGTVMCIPTHNYQVSCPHRIAAFEEALNYIIGHEGVWLATGREIAQHFISHHYDEAQASIQAGLAGVA